VKQPQVSFAKLGGAELIRLVGEIDLDNAPAIGREIVTHTTAADAVVVDLTSVSFLDSAGVRLLDALVGDLDDQGTPIRFVVGGAGAARITLQLFAFRDDLLATDLDQAAASLGG
jgi:anti-sigma B factor antagonist